MLNEKLLVATLKAMIEINYAIAKDSTNEGGLRDKAMDDYLAFYGILSMIENPDVLNDVAKIYEVKV